MFLGRLAAFAGSLVRLALYAVGALLLGIGVWMLLAEAAVQEWIPIGVAAAGLLLIGGLLVIGLSDRARLD